MRKSSSDQVTERERTVAGEGGRRRDVRKLLGKAIQYKQENSPNEKAGWSLRSGEGTRFGSPLVWQAGGRCCGPSSPPMIRLYKAAPHPLSIPASTAAFYRYSSLALICCSFSLSMRKEGRMAGSRVQHCFIRS